MKLTTGYAEQFDTIARTASVHSPSAFRWLGSKREVLRRDAKSLLSAPDVRDCLKGALETQLYSQFYCLGGLRGENDTFQVASSQALTQRHVDRLSAANVGEEHLDPGWYVESLSSDEAVLLKNGLRVTAPLTECQFDGPEIDGVQVALKTAKELLGMTPGFYLAVGSAAGELDRSRDTLVRLYWNVTPDGAIAVVRALTELLNGHGVVFRLKALKDPAAYQRCDAVVLYAPKRDLFRHWDSIAAIHRLLRGMIRTAVPAFTKALDSGLGLAEDPKQGTSFGLHRCGLIAEGLIAAYEQREMNVAGRATTIHDGLRAAGVDHDLPYLNPGNPDEYPGFVETREPKAAKSENYDPELALEAAVRIGHLLVESAVHGADECIWLGYRPTISHRATADTFGTIGPCLYDGSAGVAWLLTELFAVTGISAFRDYASAALRGAIIAAEDMPPSLFNGALGVALAAAYGARHLMQPELAQEARRLAQASMTAHETENDFDFLSGLSGRAVGLLAFWRLLGDSFALEHATLAGEQLIQLAEPSASRPGLSWRVQEKQRHPNLVGLSHGASGAAYALLSLHRVTGRRDFADCALQALSYEQSYYSGGLGGWVDLRNASRGGISVDRSRVPHYWCHGSAGIGVARLAGLDLDDECCRQQAEIALNASSAWTLSQLENSCEFGCLCHGALGNALVLVHAGRRTELEHARSFRRLAERVAQATAAKINRGQTIFGHSTQNIDNPSLMLGLTGAGHFLLHSREQRRGFMSPVVLHAA